MLNVFSGLVTYLVIGGFIALGTSSRANVVDLVLDTILWPIVLWYAWRYR